MGMDLYNLDDC
jgi:hypothetical protein